MEEDHDPSTSKAVGGEAAAALLAQRYKQLEAIQLTLSAFDLCISATSSTSDKISVKKETLSLVRGSVGGNTIKMNTLEY